MKDCNTNTTVWKDITGYEGLYKISNGGDVFNTKSKRKLKLTITDTGYHKVNLRKNGNVKTHLVHRLVALSFISNPKAKPQVNHIDENPLNNNVMNLEWCTPRENCNHGTRIERIRDLLDYEAIAKKNSKPIIQMSMQGKFIKRWESITECKNELGYDKSNIVKVLKGKARSSYGYKWMYDEMLPPA